VAVFGRLHFDGSLYLEINTYNDITNIYMLRYIYHCVFTIDGLW